MYVGQGVVDLSKQKFADGKPRKKCHENSISCIYLEYEYMYTNKFFIIKYYFWLTTEILSSLNTVFSKRNIFFTENKEWG